MKYVPFDLDSFINYCHKQAVTYGIDYKTVKTWMEPNTDKTRPFVIARGKERRDGTDTLFHKLYEPGDHSMETESHHINWFSLQDIESVNEGDHLLQIIPPTSGENGGTVYGNPLPAKHGKEISIKLGRGVLLSEDGWNVFASLDGKPAFQHYKISVNPVYIVKGDVDTASGSIKFNGDIVVNGDVYEGFAVVEVKGSVIHASVFAGHNISIGKNMIGSKVIAGGDTSYYQMLNANIQKVLNNISFMETAYQFLIKHSTRMI